MKRPKYMPLSDAEFLVWFDNFATKFALLAASLGLAGEVASILADLLYCRFVINNTEGQRQRFSDNVAVKNQLLEGSIGTAVLTYPGPAALTGLILPAAGAPPGSPSNPPPAVPAGIITRIAGTAGRILKATNYVEGMGRDLKIIPPATQPTTAADLAALKPLIEVSQQAAKVLIAWQKARGTDALRIEADYGTGTFVHVIDDTRPDHLDAHPLPASGQAAVWKYRAVYVRDGEPVGSYSDVVTVAVHGI